MAASQGVAVSEVSTGGIGLAFIVFPTAINALPNMNALMGALFFFCLIFAGFSSSMSILEVIVSGFSDKFESSRKKSAYTYIVLLDLFSHSYLLQMPDYTS